MLDPKFVRENEEKVRRALADCRSPVDLNLYLDLERRRRDLRTSVEKRKAKHNQASAQIGRMKREGQDVSAYLPKVQALAEEIKTMEEEIAAVERDFEALALQICNLPHESVPAGPDDTANQEIRRVGSPPAFSFPPRSHEEIGKHLGFLDFERGVKMSGSGFYVLEGEGALLERALANFMLDRHRKKGYREVIVPHLVHREAMVCAGQFPKFEDQAFAAEKDGLFLIPTAEVPLTNLHREEILPEESLPLKYIAWTPCYRREAGSWGKDTKGLIRVHQFQKVELYWLAHPEKSFEALEELTADAEEILQELELPYRVVVLATGDKSFTSAKTYDLEVWLPSQNTYREISSCSNCTDFQARRGKIRFRPKDGGKPLLVHTLNGSGLAVGRTWVALLENHQQGDGSVKIPKALQPYLGGMEKLKRKN